MALLKEGGAQERLSPKYISILAVVAGLILALGTWMRPRDPTAEPPVSQTELVRLRRLGQKTSLESMSGFFSEMAQEAAASVVRVQGSEVSGVVWGGRGAIAAAIPDTWIPDSVVVIAPDGTRIPASTTAAAPHLPVALLQGPPNWDVPPSPTRRIEELRLGEWILAVSRQATGSHAFIPGSYSGFVFSACGEFSYRRLLSSLNFTDSMLGAGVFDVDGNLIATIVRCGGAYTAMAMEDVGALLQEATSLRGRLLRRYGFFVARFDEVSRAYFRAEEGLWAQEVWKGFPAEAAGLLPGDFVFEWGGIPVGEITDLSRLMPEETPATLELAVRRGTRSMRILLEPKKRALPGAPSDSSQAGIILHTPPAGYPIESIAAGSPAALGGLRPGDRLLRVDNTPVTGPEVLRRLLPSPNTQPALVVVDRGDRLQAVFLQ